MKILKCFNALNESFSDFIKINIRHLPLGEFKFFLCYLSFKFSI